MTNAERAELRSLIESRIAELKASVPYLEEESKAVEPSVSLGRLTRMEALADKGVNEHVLAQSRKTLERLVPEALVCVPCAEKKR